MSKKSPPSVLLENRKARFLYFLEDFYVAGIVLTGTEIKSLRAGNASIVDAYVYVKNNEAFIANMHIAPYEKGTIYNVYHLRDRKLLLQKREIAKLKKYLENGGNTVVPTKVFLNKGFAKIEIACARGKKEHDKRDSIKEEEAKKRVAEAMKSGRKYTE
ncbi:MAG: SsrA-binding protein SmpB [Bacilli bacterium]|nr:SsrA-binding protein SmpB [Bacilli bacterium]